MSGWTSGLFAREIGQAEPELEPFWCARLDIVFALQFGLFVSCDGDIATFCSATEAVAVALSADASQPLEIF